MNPRQSMTSKEVKDFFSQTAEFAVKEEGKNIRISYTDNGKTTSTLMWNNEKALNTQQLIRVVVQLTYNHSNNILD